MKNIQHFQPPKQQAGDKMTLVTNPEMVFSSFLDGLRKVTDEFETCIDFVNESASPLTIKLNSETYISKVRELILSVASLTLENGRENKKSFVYLNSNCQNEKIRKTIESEKEKEEAQLNKIIPKKSNTKRINAQTQTKIRKDVQIKTVEMTRQRLKRRRRIISEKTKRATQLEKADKSIRTIKTETSKGFYIFYECLICQWQTSHEFSARRHVLHIHFNLGFPCPSCYVPYFNEESLQLHIPKCKRAIKRKQIKVPVQEIDRRVSKQKRPIKVHLHPCEKNSEKEESTPEKKKSKFDPQKLTVRNPFEGFDLEKSMTVKIRINRLQRQLHESKNSESTPVANEIQSQNQKQTSKENEREKETDENLTKLHNSNNSTILDLEQIRSEMVFGVEKRNQNS